jgi:hypothetical protein
VLAAFPLPEGFFLAVAFHGAESIGCCFTKATNRCAGSAPHALR